jgi:hypothetical protein
VKSYNTLAFLVLKLFLPFAHMILKLIFKINSIGDIGLSFNKTFKKNDKPKKLISNKCEFNIEIRKDIIREII